MEEKAFNIARRSFLAATATALAAIPLTGYATENSLAKTNEGDSFFDIDQELADEGKWVPMRCQPGCGGECGGKMYVKDGIILRTKSDDEGEDNLYRPQRRRCPRGRAARQTIMGADRIKYPMKRRHWEPLTGGDKSLRGKDEWERISWDEALDYVAAELQNTIDLYGNKAILCNGPVYEWGQLLNSIGDCGCTTYRDTLSHGSLAISASVVGAPYVDLTEVNGREDLPNAETVILYGMNPVWASAGNQCWYVYEGAKRTALNSFL